MRPYVLICVLVAGLLSAAEPPLLKDSGLPQGRNEDVLPMGAALHVRLANPMKSMEAIEALALQFLPEQAAPPQLRALTGQPHALLRYIGLQSVGAPIDPTLIASLTGIDAARPATLTLYPGPGGIDWILGLPVADHRVLTGLIINMTRARSFTPTTIGVRAAWVVEGANPDLPERFVVVCSKDAAYCCSDERIASLLAGAAPLAKDPAIAAAPAGSDLAVTVCATPAKPFVQMFTRQFAKLPPRMFDGLRDQAVRAMGRDGVNNINLQLRLRTNLANLQECFDFAECLSASALETFVPGLSKQLMGIDGATLSCEFRPEGVRAALIVQAAGIEALAAKPLPMPEVKLALAALPGDRSWFSVVGGRAPEQPGSLRADWLDLATRKLAAKGVTSTLLPALAVYWRAEERVPGLADAAPWVLRTSMRPQTVAPAGPGLGEWFAAMLAAMPLPDLEVLPQQKGDAVASTFKAMAEVENRNAARWTTALTSSLGDTRWIDSASRFRREARPGKADRLVYEDAWITRSGLFGYSQHELINRIIAYSAVRGTLQLLQRVDGDRTCWLDDAPVAAPPLPPAVDNLLAQVPVGADNIAVVRVLPGLGAILDGFASLEKAARHDLDAYIAACTTAINSNVGNQKAVLAALQQVPMPLTVTSLNIDPQTRALYLVLPGKLRYPRPEIAPVLHELFAGFLAKADAGGGLVLWSRAEPGRMTWALHQDLRSLAWLVRSTGNAVHTAFLTGGDPVEAVREVLGHPADGEDNPKDQVIIYSTAWPDQP